MEQAADEIIFVAFSSDVKKQSGKFFVYGKIYPPAVTDKDTIEKLWKLSMEYVGLTDADPDTTSNKSTWAETIFDLLSSILGISK